MSMSSAPYQDRQAEIEQFKNNLIEDIHRRGYHKALMEADGIKLRELGLAVLANDIARYSGIIQSIRIALGLPNV